MRTIVFHSYKGGVGRSLALANLGMVLSRFGQRVVMLDLDVDAPGLYLKFKDQQARNVGRGYIDYLETYCRPQSARVSIKTVLQRKTERDKTARASALRDIAIAIGDNLKVIPAGNGTVEYWRKLADKWFQELFSLSQKEISPSGRIDLHKHRDFLRKELDSFKDLFNMPTDYLLIDCRSSREYSSVPLYYWADILVSMLPANVEGVRGAVHIHQSVLKARSSAEPARQPPTTFHVICRVPENFSEKDAQGWRDKFNEYWQSLDPNLRVPEEPFLILHEYRSLETAERILLAVTRDGEMDEIDVPLAHDYVTLFRRILEGDPGVESALPSTDERAWRAALGLAEDVDVLKRYFRQVAHNEVAVRTDTLLALLNSLSQFERENLAQLSFNAEDADEWILKAFHHAGLNIGRDFGRDAMEGGPLWETVPEKEIDRLVGWCNFDQEARFGSLVPHYSAETRSGRIVWKDSFLLDHGQLQPHVEEFARGYVRGVLTELLRSEVEVSVNDFEEFNFTQQSVKDESQEAKS